MSDVVKAFLGVLQANDEVTEEAKRLLVAYKRNVAMSKDADNGKAAEFRVRAEDAKRRAQTLQGREQATQLRRMQDFYKLADEAERNV